VGSAAPDRNLGFGRVGGRGEIRLIIQRRSAPWPMVRRRHDLLSQGSFGVLSHVRQDSRHPLLELRESSLHSRRHRRRASVPIARHGVNDRTLLALLSSSLPTKLLDIRGDRADTQRRLTCSRRLSWRCVRSYGPDFRRIRPRPGRLTETFDISRQPCTRKASSNKACCPPIGVRVSVGGRVARPSHA
jgi:hypothetical protein